MSDHVCDIECAFHIELAIQRERERIIQDLEKTYNWNQAIEFDRDELIAIIKGEKSE